MGAPAIFEKQIEIKLLHPVSTVASWIQDQFRSESLNERYGSALVNIIAAKICIIGSGQFRSPT
jgi:hypothetical protein